MITQQTLYRKNKSCKCPFCGIKNHHTNEWRDWSCNHFDDSYVHFLMDGNNSIEKYAFKFTTNK